MYILHVLIVEHVKANMDLFEIGIRVEITIFREPSKIAIMGSHLMGYLDITSENHRSRDL